jgi:CheY-like chemotaxis protein
MTQAKPNILIVEDDFISREVLKAMLSCYPVTVQCAESGAEALAAIATQTPQLLLLDHELPDMTGVALYQLLIEQLPNTPAALISSHAVDLLIDDAQVAGIAHVLSKPLEPSQLADLLRVTGCI